MLSLPLPEVLGGAVDKALAPTRAEGHACAPIEERFDEKVVVHSVPPDEKAQVLGFHQGTAWTTYLQFKGTPLFRL